MKCTHEQAQSQSQSRYQPSALVTSIQSLTLTYKHGQVAATTFGIPG